MTQDIAAEPRADSANQSRVLATDLRMLIDASLDAIVIMDAGGRIAAWNRRATEMFGWSTQETYGKNLAELLIPEELRSAHSAGYERRLTQEENALGAVHEFPALRRDGTRFPAEVSISMLRTRWGPMFVGFLRDITQRVNERTRQRELQRANELTQLIIKNTGLLIATIAIDRSFLTVNEQACDVLGYTRDELLGRTVRDVIAPEDLERIEASFARVAREGTADSGFEVTVVRKDGERRQLSFGLTPLFDDDTVTGFVGAAEDITDRLRTQEALANTQKLESLSALAGGVAHDFNNLLMTILGNAAVLRTLPPGDAQVGEALQDIETAGQQAAELARQMLAYAGKASTTVEGVNLSELVVAMDPLLRAVVARNVELSYKPCAACPVIEADITQLRQVILNIVVNAAEALGASRGCVVIATGQRDLDHETLSRCVGGEGASAGRYAFIRVTDDGPGMAPDIRQRVFDPFFSTRFPGRGLGLAAVFGIVRGHHGVLDVESAPGEGASFTVYLPAAV